MSVANGSRLGVSQAGPLLEGYPYHFHFAHQDDRIRKIFGLADDLPLPLVDDDSLAIYYDHLASRLAMPFDALYGQHDGEMRQLVSRVCVTDVLDPRQTGGRNRHGLLCQIQGQKGTRELPLADFGVVKNDGNRQLVDDYAYWLINCR